MKSILKKAIALTLAAVLALSLVPLNAQAVSANRNLPYLTDSYTDGEGSFTLTKDARLFIISDSEPKGELLQTAQLINSAFAAANLPSSGALPLVWGTSNKIFSGDIVLALVAQSQTNYGAEGYGLSVTASNITVSANDVNGLLYGAYMIIKYFQVYNGSELPACSVRDCPDTAERTLMLDCARKYWSVDWIKNLIRQMSWMGYNTLELHMTEDQGARMNIWRDKNGNVVPDCNGNDFGWMPGYKVAQWASAAADPNGSKQYNRDEIIEILECAAEYHIDVIPAIDVPGHCDYFIYQWDNSGASSNFTFNYQGQTYSNRPSQIYISDSFLYYSGYRQFGTLDITNTYTRNMSMALMEAYAVFFQTYGNSTVMNIGCDEVRGSLSADSVRSYINDVCAMLKGHNFRVRAYNDYFEENGTIDSLDKDLEICWWIPSSSSASSLAQKRKLYNCYNAYCYYVLRDKNGTTQGTSADARDPANTSWTFHHSTADRIYEGCKGSFGGCSGDGGWNPSRMYAYNGGGTSVSNVSGGYFLIWGDWAGWCTEKNVWTGIDSSGKYNLVERMWSSGTKMWNWDINNTLNYSGFSTLCNKFFYYPGFRAVTQDGGATLSTVSVSIPQASALQAAQIADFSALDTAIAEAKKLDKADYTADSYAKLTAALREAEAIQAVNASSQEQIDAAVSKIKAAMAALVLIGLPAVIYQAMIGDTVYVIDRTEYDSNTDVTLELGSRRGFRFLRVEGNVQFRPYYSGAEGGVAVGTVTPSSPIVVWYENTPDLSILARLLSADCSGSGSEAYRNAMAEAQAFYDNVKNAPSEKTYQNDIDAYSAKIILTRTFASFFTDASTATKIISIKKNADYVAQGKSAVLVVVTSPDVTSLVVKDSKDVEVTLKECIAQPTVTDSKENVKVWYLSFPMDAAGLHSFTLYAKGNTNVSENVEILCN